MRALMGSPYPWVITVEYQYMLNNPDLLVDLLMGMHTVITMTTQDNIGAEVTITMKATHNTWADRMDILVMVTDRISTTRACPDLISTTRLTTDLMHISRMDQDRINTGRPCPSRISMPKISTDRMGISRITPDRTNRVRTYPNRIERSSTNGKWEWWIRAWPHPIE